VTTAPTPPTIIRTVTYYSLSEPRQWTSADGRPLLAKLIAFEEHVAESVKGAPLPAPAPAPVPTALSAPPTVVREGKARFLANNQPHEIPIDRLSEPDRAFIERIRDGLAKQAAATAAAKP
jgi:hypothetical protein